MKRDLGLCKSKRHGILRFQSGKFYGEKVDAMEKDDGMDNENRDCPPRAGKSSLIFLDRLQRCFRSTCPIAQCAAVRFNCDGECDDD